MVKGAGPADRLVTVEVARLLLDRVIAAEPGQAGARRLFEAQSQAYLAHPRRLLKGRRRRNGQLAFGPTEIEHLLNPILIAAAGEVLGYLAGEAVLRGGAMSVRRVRRLFGAPAPSTALPDPAPDPLSGNVIEPGSGAPGPGAPGPGSAGPGAAEPVPPEGGDDSVAPLTIQQWARVREVMTEALIRHGNLPREWADRLAVAAVGEGVLSEPGA